MSANGKYKLSAHLVIDGYYVMENKECKYFCLKVLDSIKPRKKDDICNLIYEYADLGIYDNNKSLRTLYNFKRKDMLKSVNEMRPKIIDNVNKHFSYERSLITNIDNCVELKRICDNYDEVEDKKSLEDMELTPEMIEGLNWLEPAIKKHINESLYVDWSRSVGRFIHIGHSGSYFCKICKRDHDSDNATVSITKNGIWFKCWRSKGQSGRIDLTIYSPNYKKFNPQDKKQQKILEYKQEMDIIDEVLKGDIKVSNEELELLKERKKKKEKYRDLFTKDETYGDYKLYLDRDEIKNIINKDLSDKDFIFVDNQGNQLKDVKCDEYDDEHIKDFYNVLKLVKKDTKITVAIWAEMGTGKTTKTAEAIQQADIDIEVKELLGKLDVFGSEFISKICIISSRYMFATELRSKLKKDYKLDFVIYNDYELDEKDNKVRVDVSKEKRYIVQCESFHKVKKSLPTMLIIDENISVSQQMDSPLHNTKFKQIERELSKN